MIAALMVFNAMFAVQNGLDLAFLWSGARLPLGLTLADYAHRGADPLIFTALLAAAFSLFVLRDSSPSARRPIARRLVGLWIAQNVLLSASSLLRTIDYLQAYSLTRLRIAALLWMGLVMLGLALIGWRKLRGRSAGWLINANALALVLVLAFADLADLGAVAAWWNVLHAREVGGHGADLDVCYLSGLGSAALLPLIALEQRPIGPLLRRKVQIAREIALNHLADAQSEWRGWTARGAVRLSLAETESARLPAGLPACTEVIPCGNGPAPPAPAASPTLTPGEKP